MKQIFIFFSFLTSLVISAQIVNIPDANFKAYLVGNSQINTNGDSEIQISEAESYNYDITCVNKNIADLTGIEKFINLSSLDVRMNNLTSLDLSKNIKLYYLDCYRNKLTNVNITNCTKLKYLFFNDNKLTSFDFSTNIELQDINCSQNQLLNLDLSKNPDLVTVSCADNKLLNIDLGNSSKIESFVCSNNNLSDLNIASLVSLYELYCDANTLESLDTSKNTQLIRLYIDANTISSLDVSKNVKLGTLSSSNNLLTELDISKIIDLRELNITSNKLISLNLKNGQNRQLTKFFAINNTNLNCIQVDDPAYSTIRWPNKDPWATYSTDCSLGINDINKSTTYIYPNPVKEKFIINPNDKIEYVEIYSQTGQLLKTVKSKEVNISNFPKGNYLVKIKTDKDNINQKIIKE